MLNVYYFNWEKMYISSDSKLFTSVNTLVVYLFFYVVKVESFKGGRENIS